MCVYFLFLFKVGVTLVESQSPSAGTEKLAVDWLAAGVAWVRGQREPSDLTGRPGAEGHFGLETATEQKPQGTLDLLVAEGIDNRVDHGVVGGW